MTSRCLVCDTVSQREVFTDGTVLSSVSSRQRVVLRKLRDLPEPLLRKTLACVRRVGKRMCVLAVAVLSV